MDERHAQEARHADELFVIVVLSHKVTFIASYFCSSLGIPAQRGINRGLCPIRLVKRAPLHLIFLKKKKISSIMFFLIFFKNISCVSTKILQ